MQFHHRRKKSKSYCNCGQEKDNRSNQCYQCSKIKSRKFIWPTKEELQNLISQIPMTEIAKKFGISNSALNKICNKLNIKKLPQGYWTRIACGYSHEEALISHKRIPKNHQNKLNKEMVLEIKELLKQKILGIREIARKFRVAHQTISKIRDNKIYKNI